MLTILLLLVIVVWLTTSFWKGIKKVQIAEVEVRQELNKIAQLDITEAERLSQQRLPQLAHLQKWPSTLPFEVEADLIAVDISLSQLLCEFQAIRFHKSGTEISADLISSVGMPDGVRMIGQNATDDYKLGVRANDPSIYEFAHGRISESYPSIHHYILMIEDIE